MVRSRSQDRGDGFDFYQEHLKQDAKTAFVPFIELAGLGDELKKRKKTKEKPAALSGPLGPIVTAEQIYFDHQQGCYWKVDRRGIWLRLSKTDVASHLADKVYCPFLPKNGYLSDVDRILNEIQMSMGVEYANALAGHQKGIFHLRRQTDPGNQFTAADQTEGR